MNPKVAKLFAKYDELEHEIRRIERQSETPGDDDVHRQKQKRVQLKDPVLRYSARGVLNDDRPQARPPGTFPKEHADGPIA